MSPVETTLVVLGAAVVKSACKIWMGDRKVAADVSSDAIDLISGRAVGLLEQRKLRRLFEDMEEAVARQLQPLLDAEFRGLPDNERAAAILAVHDTFERGKLDDDDLFAVDLDAGFLDRHLRTVASQVREQARLSTGGEQLYDRLLRESCSHLVEITRTLPRFGGEALTVLLRRDSEIIRQLTEVLRRLPERRGAVDYEADYRRQVVSLLDQAELFGVTLSAGVRRYPLSLAYISLDVAGTNQDAHWPSVSIEDALGESRLLFVRGEAGSGKTTLLQWIAVRLAAGDAPASLADWSDCLPFLIRLRRYVTGALPAPDRFLDEVGRHIADEMPEHWCHSLLREGRAVVLVDGLDELPQLRRDEVRRWLRELMVAYPQTRCVVTSRRAAAEQEWLAREGFTTAELLPMRPVQIRAFVKHWHVAVAAESVDEAARAEVAGYERRFLDALERRTLRLLASSPLLCALLCALHHDHRGQLPANRMELYGVALTMLLGRRDLERRVESAVHLPLEETVLLLQDVAFWLLENGWTDAERKRVVGRLSSRLSTMHRVTFDAESVCQHLLERSGLLQEPIADRVDFVHRTFQEYLAAKAVVDEDRIGFLINQAHLDQWREVVVMAAGHASRSQCDELLHGILNRLADGDERTSLDLLAAACLETAPDLVEPLRAEIEQRMAAYVPPADAEAGRSLARLGDSVLDLLAASRPVAETKVAATIATCAEIGGDDALRIIATHGGDTRPIVEAALFAAWARFDPRQYANDVLLRRTRDHIRVDDPSILTAIDLFRDLHSIEWVGPDVWSNASRRTVIENLSSLRAVTLLGMSLQDLEELDLPARIEQLGIVRMRLLTTLSPLASARHVSGLLLEDCRELTDISDLQRWSSLCTLSLHRLPIRDIWSLAGLQLLERVSLQGCHGIGDLRPLTGLANLRSLDLRDGPRHGFIETRLARRGVEVVV